MAAEYSIERYRPGVDDLGELTELLHRAYAPLLDAGMNYIAATQSVEITRQRLAAASASWIARANGRIIGTVCYHSRVTHEGRPQWFALEGIGVFAQFAVEPELQKRGIGYELLSAVEQSAIAEGKSELACDTAVPATHLREYYARNGFREVAMHRWPHATYTSVILSKKL